MNSIVRFIERIIASCNCDFRVLALQCKIKCASKVLCKMCDHILVIDARTIAINYIFASECSM